VLYEDFYKWTNDYFDSIGINQEVSKLIQFFVDNKIFGVEGNSIFVKYKIFLSFFVAHRMTRSNEFYKWVFDEDRYYKYVNEIELYCGLSRIDVGALEYLGAEFQKFADRISKILSILACNRPLEKLELPIVENRVEFAKELSRQLLALDMPAEARDEELEQKESLGDDVRPTLERPEVRHDIDKWFEALRAYTAALKNLENISREKKEEHLEKVLEGWSAHLTFICWLVKLALVDQKIVLGTLEFKFELPEHIDGQKLRLFFLRLPTETSGLLRKHLGSQKLELQLRRDNPKHSLAVAFLQTGLYADLKLREYLNQLESLRRRVSESSFFLEALLVKLRDIYLRFDVAPNERLAFRRLVAEIAADIDGHKGRIRSAEISKSMQSLKRVEQVARLRDAAS
jgi:hypothetical protein